MTSTAYHPYYQQEHTFLKLPGVLIPSIITFTLYLPCVTLVKKKKVCVCVVGGGGLLPAHRIESSHWEDREVSVILPTIKAPVIVHIEIRAQTF